MSQPCSSPDSANATMKPTNAVKSDYNLRRRPRKTEKAAEAAATEPAAALPKAEKADKPATALPKSEIVDKPVQSPPKTEKVDKPAPSLPKTDKADKPAQSRPKRGKASKAAKASPPPRASGDNILAARKRRMAAVYGIRAPRVVKLAEKRTIGHGKDGYRQQVLCKYLDELATEAASTLEALKPTVCGNYPNYLAAIEGNCGCLCHERQVGSAPGQCRGATF